MSTSSDRTARALRASRRDPQAFGAVFTAESEAVLMFLARRTLDPEVALDLLAETFAQAYRGRRGFRGDSDAEARGWLYAIARARLARWWEQGRVERDAIRRIGLTMPRWTEDDLARVEERADLGALRSDLAAGLAALPPGVRDAVELRVVEELDHATVARRLGISEEASRARVSRGLRALHGALTGEGSA